MADDAATELAKNILKNVVPLDSNNALVRGAQGVQDMATNLLQKLGLMPTPQQSIQGGPQFPINAPLPQVNPQTGGINYPPGYQGPR